MVVLTSIVCSVHRHSFPFVFNMREVYDVPSCSMSLTRRHNADGKRISDLIVSTFHVLFVMLGRHSLTDCSCTDALMTL